MRAYLARRAAALALVLVGVTVLSFALGHFAPGDPAQLLLEQSQGQAPSDEQVRAKRQELGLDRPLVVQYGDWSLGVLRGDLGESWANGDSVSGLLRNRFPRTALLGITAVSLSVLIAIPFGALAARSPNSLLDHASRVTAMAGASLPSFFIGYLLMYLFGVALQVLPTSGYGSPRHLVLPACTLALGSAAVLTRLTRSSFLEVMSEPYIQSAHAKGVTGRRVLFRHGLRNALNPILSVSGLQLGHLLAGAVVVEWIYAWPGLGKLAVDAIYDRDYPLIQGFVLLSATIVVLTNLVTDLAYAWTDPRVRLDRAPAAPAGT